MASSSWLVVDPRSVGADLTFYLSTNMLVINKVLCNQDLIIVREVIGGTAVCLAGSEEALRSVRDKL